MGNWKVVGGSVGRWSLDLIKPAILTFSSVQLKIFQTPHVILQTTSQFFFKFCMTLQCHQIYSSVLF